MRVPLLLVLAGCSAEQAYHSGQNWQRNQCTRHLDKAEYDRCMASTARTYDDYRRDREGR